MPLVIIIAMAISGAFAGLMATNEILGRTAQGAAELHLGATGLPALRWRSWGVTTRSGIFLASLLFGVLYQGGAELDFEFQSITREMVLVIQGMIILFSGALAYMFNPPLARLIHRIRSNRAAANG